MKKIIGVLVCIVLIACNVTVFADDSNSHTWYYQENLFEDDHLTGTLKRVNSFSELTDYLALYRQEYAKDKNFCTIKNPYNDIGGFYNKLDYIYLPKNVSTEEILSISLDCNYIFITFKKDNVDYEFYYDTFPDIKNSYYQYKNSNSYKVNNINGYDVFSINKKLFKMSVGNNKYTQINANQYTFFTNNNRYVLRGNCPETKDGLIYCDFKEAPVAKDISAGCSCIENVTQLLD